MSRPTRRSFLRGAGVTMALPFLPSAFPRQARAGGVIPPRLLWVYCPNGQPMSDWIPSATGPDWPLSTVLAPFAPIKHKVSVLSGLNNEPAFVAAPSGHPAGTAAFLTGVTPEFGAAGLTLANSISVDQVAANSLPAGTTPFPSVQILTRKLGPIGHCGQGIPCDYLNSISWADEQTPLPGIWDPQLLFDRFFASFDATESAKEQQQRRMLRTSVIDAVLENSNSLRSRLGNVDQRKLDQYLDGLRDLEVHIETLSNATCEAPERPDGDLEVTPWIDAMNGLIAVAFRCDLTRVATFMHDVGFSNRAMGHLGLTGGHHHYSHHFDQQERWDGLVQIGIWQSERVVHLLQTLDAMDEGDGTTVLDNTLVMYSNELADGNYHEHHNLPVVLAGGGALGANPGRHIDFGSDAIAKLHVSMLNAFGVNIGTFGQDGNGPLSGLFG